MKRWLILAALAAGFFASPSAAQTCQVAPGTVSASGTVQLQCDTSGNLKTTGGGGTAALPATGTGGTSAVTLGTTATMNVSAAAVRTARLSITNLHATAKVYCTLGATTPVAAAAGTFIVGAGQILSFANDVYVPADALNCISDTASTPATVWSK